MHWGNEFRYIEDRYLYIDSRRQSYHVQTAIATQDTVITSYSIHYTKLYDILLSNNGFKVFNIGIKVPAETIIQKAREYRVDLIGLSGLLVKSAIIMQESMPQYREAGLKVPILLGGAALTPEFVADACVSYNFV